MLGGGDAKETDNGRANSSVTILCLLRTLIEINLGSLFGGDANRYIEEVILRNVGRDGEVVNYPLL